MLLLVGVPGSGIATAYATFPGPKVAISELIAKQTGQSVEEWAIIDPQRLPQLEDEALASLDPRGVDLIVFDGSTLTRAANRELVAHWPGRRVELWADLATMADRLGFNAARSIALGPARATLAQMAQERRAAWAGWAPEAINTSQFPPQRLKELIAALIAGERVVS